MADPDLAAHLLTHPDDAEVALVYADQLQADGDPRGELIALQHAIAHAQPAAIPPLEARAAALVRQHRATLLDRPGGFPFRPRWRGRAYIRHTATLVLPGAPGPALYTRLHRFFDELTDSTGPDEILAPHDREIELKLSTFGYTRTSTDQVQNGWGRGAARARRVHEMIADLVETWPGPPRTGLVLLYRFRLAFPWSGVPLPYQQRAFSPEAAEDLGSTLRVQLVDGATQLQLIFPFEDLGDAFVRCHDEIAARLGRGCLSPPFQLCLPGGIESRPFDRAAYVQGSTR